MKLLERTVSWDQLVRWGALRLYPERHVRKWFGDRDTLTVDEALDLGTKATRIYWAVMRTEVLPPRALHQVAHDLCAGFLDELERDGAYLDFRLRVALAAKGAWIRGQISDGVLCHHQRVAHRVEQDVAGHPTGADVATLAALATRSALEIDADEAFKGVFYVMLEQRDDARSQRETTALIRTTLSAFPAPQEAP